MLDHWEVYPDWYYKKAVIIRANDGNEYEAFIYTVDYDGEKLAQFKRVVNDLAEVVVNAKAARKKVMEKFPKAFSC